MSEMILESSLNYLSENELTERYDTILPIGIIVLKNRSYVFKSKEKQLKKSVNISVVMWEREKYMKENNLKEHEL